MLVLHFHDAFGARAVRLQHLAQSELNMGIQPVILVKKRSI